jgi:hypothetical protein
MSDKTVYKYMESSIVAQEVYIYILQPDLTVLFSSVNFYADRLPVEILFREYLLNEGMYKTLSLTASFFQTSNLNSWGRRNQSRDFKFERSTTIYSNNAQKRIYILYKE